jgi:hypothetical protein
MKRLIEGLFVFLCILLIICGVIIAPFVWFVTGEWEWILIAIILIILSILCYHIAREIESY